MGTTSSSVSERDDPLPVKIDVDNYIAFNGQKAVTPWSS